MNSIKNKKISVIIPFYNEEECIPLLYERLRTVLLKVKISYEILFVDDGSSDHSVQVIKKLQKDDPQVSFIKLSRNFGKEVAMVAGIDHAEGDAVILMDADLQHPPEYIPILIKEWQNGYDMVYAVRNHRQDSSWLTVWLSSFYHKLIAILSDVKLEQGAGDFRLLSRKACKIFKQYREQERYTKGIYQLIGLTSKKIEYEENDRVAGTTKWSAWSLFRVGFNGITSFSVKPLRLASILGLGITGIAFIYALYELIRTLIYGNPVPGYPSLMIIILFLGGVQLVSIGIIGEYLSKIYTEVKKRPLYTLDENEIDDDEYI